MKDALRIFVPIAPNDPFYVHFREHWKAAAATGASAAMWAADAPALRELSIDLADAQKQADRAIRELVAARLDNRHLDAKIDKELDVKVATAVRQAVDAFSAKADTTARDMLRRKVSDEIAAGYEIDVEVRIRRKDGR